MKMIIFTSLIILTGCFGTKSNPTTLLQSCKAGYYLNDMNGCVRCTHCSRNQKQVMKCAELADTVCVCPQHMFYHSGALSCKPCDVCRVGFYLKETCNTSRNTVCQPCSVGSTSPGNNSLVCTPQVSNGGTSRIIQSQMLVILVSSVVAVIYMY